MKRYLLAASLFAAAFAQPAQAQTTVRRVLLLCTMEDPQCGPALRQAEQEARHHPNLGGQTCVIEHHIPIARVYHAFMEAMTPGAVGNTLAEAPAWYGMWVSLHADSLC